MGGDGIDVDTIKALEGALAGPDAEDHPLVIGARIDPASMRRSSDYPVARGAGVDDAIKAKS
jgi:thiamine pyrophosphate-dependent acetolactate synthase large subunit-like protein